MNKSCLVIGSGPSGANAALTLLKRGFVVNLIDGGAVEKRTQNLKPFEEFKDDLTDPWNYFLGDQLQGIIPPNSNSIFQYPPNRNYFDKETSIIKENFIGHTSMAVGGLGIGWGANCAEFNDNDLDKFLINQSDLIPYYKKISKRINVSGSMDDPLSIHLGKSSLLSSPLELSLHDKIFLDKSIKHKKFLNKNGIIIGRSRMAVNTIQEHSNSCRYTGRCLWGCPQKAIYDPNQTINECNSFKSFKHLKGYKVVSLVTKHSKVIGASAISKKDNNLVEFNADIFILAAGAINTGKIYLRTILKDKQFERLYKDGTLSTKSILDTKTIKIPYILPKMIGKKNLKNNFQFNKLAMGVIESNTYDYPNFIHGEILSLNSLIYHPLIESLPFGTKISSSLFSLLHTSLGVVTLFFPDKPSQGKALNVSLDRFSIDYTENDSQKKISEKVTKKVRSALFHMGIIAPKFQTIYSPPGSGLHYAGTVPMSKNKDPLCVDKDCRSYAYDNVFIVDGSVFPELPSKSFTYSIMANSIRVCELI